MRVSYYIGEGFFWMRLGERGPGIYIESKEYPENFSQQIGMEKTIKAFGYRIGRLRPIKH